MSNGLVARLKSPLHQRADFAEVLTGGWTTLASLELARRPVYLEHDGQTALGELFDVTGDPDGSLRVTGDLSLGDRIAAVIQDGRLVAGRV